MQSFFIDNKHLDLVAINGADAEKFLQGQLTCDIAGLEQLGHCFGCVCNNKGRIIAPFLLLRVAESYHLVFTAGLGELFISQLQKFLPFYKCTMVLNPEDFQVCALSGEEAAIAFHSRFADNKDKDVAVPGVSGAESWLLSVGNQHPLFITGNTRQTALPDRKAFAAGDQQQWLLQLMLNGHFPFTTEDSEQFTPQEIGLDRKHYVSFSKGCYTGQEIVARMHYRGKLKKQLYLLTLTLGAEENIDSLEILDGQNKSLGRCTKAIRSSDDLVYALISLPVDLPGDIALHTNSGTTVTVNPF